MAAAGNLSQSELQDLVSGLIRIASKIEESSQSGLEDNHPAKPVSEQIRAERQALTDALERLNASHH